MAATSTASASVVCVGLAIGVVGPAVWYAVARRRGHPQAALRELAWMWAAAVPFSFCASVAVAYPRWRWLLGVAIVISLASTVQQLAAFHRERNRASGSIGPGDGPGTGSGRPER